jgi:choline dehydrogenase
VRYDVVVLGGGSAGCVLAARLSEDAARAVCLVEAGPDYGPYADGRWPDDLLDPDGIPDSHQWHAEESRFEPLRARVLGGCSAHNACFLVWAPATDYDAWGPGWRVADLAPHMRRAQQTMAPDPLFYSEEQFSPWFAATVAAADELGMPLLGDINEPIEAIGIGTGPFNVTGGVRWNAAFAYLDPARPRANLTILAETLVDRVVVEGDRATGVVTTNGTVEADTVVLAAGAIGSPCILLRSGIGPERELAAHGIGVVSRLDAVGENLSDHGTAWLSFDATDELRKRTAAEAPVAFANGVIKARTDRCPDDAFDLHILPVTSRVGDDAHFTIALMHVDSRGQVRLRSADPSVAPEVDHRLLSDPHGNDRATLRAGFELAQRLAERTPVGRLGTPRSLDDQQLGIYFHPVGTCALGSVVERDGRVVGCENLYVSDASIMPTVPRANTHLTVLGIAEKLAEVI